ncbi:MarR family winged helix-turn-helix transcriptional regulator [Pseudonocardia sp. CA-107938]|uniref:MarR family winged helix-turn-helix transcriptional regulator n=1 Tax=Pseudonocardia sp. CA-107938 TaxID=3240021 RepID=UPI003D8BCC16
MAADAVDEIAQQWARERPDMPVDSIGVVARILRIAKLITDERRRTLSAIGIDVATFDLLATLRRSGTPYRMSPTGLAEACLVSGGAITQRVARAEEAGLVRTTRTDSGRRTLTVELTPQGHDVVERDVEALIGRERELIGHLPAGDQEQLADLLRRLLAGLPG